jgi:hypothetical protein
VGSNVCCRLSAASLIAEVMGMDPARLMPLMEAAVTTFLRLRGDPRVAVDKALVEAHRRGSAFPPSERTHHPSPEPFVMPQSMAEATRCYGATRAELARVRIRLKSGELLSKGRGDFAGASRRVGWIQGAQDEFAAAHGAEPSLRPASILRAIWGGACGQ